MKHAGGILTQVLVVVAALAVYHLVFHAGRAPGGRDDATGEQAGGTPFTERQEIDRQLLTAEGVVAEAYDEGTMRALVRDAGVELTPEQAREVLPLLHQHLLTLRRNMEEAREAAVAGAPDAQRSVFRARAAQAHGLFQRKLRGLVPAETALALYRACPPLLPPIPGSTSGAPKPPPEPAPPQTTIAPESR